MGTSNYSDEFKRDAVHQITVRGYQVLSSRPGDPLGSLRMDPLRVTYASDGEMAAALADLNRQIAGATDRISVVRIQSSKGL